MPPSGTTKALLFRLMPSLVLVFLLLGLEGAARLMWEPLPALDVLVAAPDQLMQLVGRQDNEARRQRPRLFEADPLLFWRLKPNVPPMVWNQTLVSTNAQGLRHPGPIEPKRPGRRRIVCLGDSVTFGFRVPLATTDDPRPRPGQPYPRVLEEKMRARGHDAEVIAMAVPGYSSHQGLAWARRDLAALAPDDVIVCYGWNDVSAMPRPDHEAMPGGFANVTARAALAHTQAGLQLLRVLREYQTRTALGEPVARVPRDRYVANIRGIVAEARRHRARTVVVSPVYRDRTTMPDEAARMHDHRRALAEAMRADGTPWIEIADLTEAGAPGNAHLFVEHIHPNEQGHRRLGEVLAGVLDSLRLSKR